MDEQPQNILEIGTEDSQAIVGEKLILNGMARDYFQRKV